MLTFTIFLLSLAILRQIIEEVIFNVNVFALSMKDMIL